MYSKNNNVFFLINLKNFLKIFKFLYYNDIKKFKIIFKKKLYLYVKIKNNLIIKNTIFETLEFKEIIINILYKDIINYYKYKISFGIYDCVFYNNNEYAINSINVIHYSNKIEINFLKKDLIAGINIAILKFDEIHFNDKYLFFNNIKLNNISELELIDLLYPEDNIKLIISSNSNYNFLEEKGIIVYFDTNFEYNGHYLNKILKNKKLF